MSVLELKALARQHWEEWLPEKVKELQAEGTLNEELHSVAVLAQAEIEHLMKRGYSDHEAREVALPMFILLPPEMDGLSEEQREELAEKEREYQKNPPVMSSEDEDMEEPIGMTQTKSQPISTSADHASASSTAPKPRSRPLSDLDMDDIDTEFRPGDFGENEQGTGSQGEALPGFAEPGDDGRRAGSVYRHVGDLGTAFENFTAPPRYGPTSKGQFATRSP